MYIQDVLREIAAMLIKGRKAICSYIGENCNRFRDIYKNERLPAFRTRENGTWKARSRDLDKWIDKKAEHLLGDRLED